MNLNITTELSTEAQNPLLRVGAVMPSCLSHGSLFSGIGGFDLAAQWMGWNNIFQCEKDEWCRKVLAKNFPNTKRFEDIKQFNAKEYNGTIDVISGGFPCQPFSVAGQRKGKDDDRYLWEEMLRVIGEVQPKFVVGENVTGIIGMALDTVLSDLEAQNYTTETYIIPACSKNAWHRRDRVWIVAYSNSIRRNNEQKENGQPLHNGNRNGSTKEQSGGKQQRRTGEPGSILSNSESKLSNERENGNDTEQGKIQLQTGGSNSVSADTNGIGWENGLHGKEQRGEAGKLGNTYTEQYRNYWETEPELGRVVDGLSGRVDRLKGLGNAIVPQVAYEIFRSIGELHWHGA
jgi:DNA (cytosine-5)-methyltransferase 1